jgi:hypothetical protein
LVTASSVMSERFLPARAAASAILASTCSSFSLSKAGFSFVKGRQLE